VIYIHTIASSSTLRNVEFNSLLTFSLVLSSIISGIFVVQVGKVDLSLFRIMFVLVYPSILFFNFRNLKFNLLDLYLLSFIAAIIPSILNYFTFDCLPNIDYFLRYILNFIFVFTVINIISGFKNKDLLYNVLFIASLVNAFFIFLQYLSGKSLVIGTQSLNMGFDLLTKQFRNRPIGVAQDPNYAGALSIIFIAISLCLKRGLRKIILAILGVFSIILTASIGALISMLAFFFIYAIAKKKPRIVLTIGLLIVIIPIFLLLYPEILNHFFHTFVDQIIPPQTPKYYSLYSRVLMIYRQRSILVNNIFMPIGIGYYSNQRIGSYSNLAEYLAIYKISHVTPINSVVEEGIISYLSFSLMFLTALKKAIYKNLSIAALLLALFIHSFTIPYIHFIPFKILVYSAYKGIINTVREEKS